MSLSTGNRLKWVKQSEIRNMSLECEKYGGINLSQGVCDLEVPSIVAQGAKQAIDDGVNAYTRYDGLNELREAIAKRQKNFSGMEIDPDIATSEYVDKAMAPIRAAFPPQIVEVMEEQMMSG